MLFQTSDPEPDAAARPTLDVPHCPARFMGGRGGRSGRLGAVKREAFGES